jgi:hypothetical protein
MQAEQLERRIHRYVEARCQAILQSDAVQLSLQARLDDQRRKMEAEVDAELTAERARAEEARKAKEAAIVAKKAEIQALHDTRKQEVCRVVLCAPSLGVSAIECVGICNEPSPPRWRRTASGHTLQCFHQWLLFCSTWLDESTEILR